MTRARSSSRVVLAATGLSAPAPRRHAGHRLQGRAQARLRQRPAHPARQGRRRLLQPRPQVQGDARGLLQGDPAERRTSTGSSSTTPAATRSAAARSSPRSRTPTPNPTTVKQVNPETYLKGLLATAGKLPAPDDDTMYMLYFPSGVDPTDGQRLVVHRQRRLLRLPQLVHATGGQIVRYGVMPDMDAGQLQPGLRPAGLRQLHRRLVARAHRGGHRSRRQRLVRHRRARHQPEQLRRDRRHLRRRWHGGDRRRSAASSCRRSGRTRTTPASAPIPT